MLGVLIALAAGGLTGVCIGAWLVADNVRHNQHRACLACGRPWHDLTDPQPHVHVIERAPNVRRLPPTSQEDRNE